MRILWSSNAIWAHTGYGVQAKYLLPRFMEMGHQCAQFAWYGLQGAKLDAGGLTIYPGVADEWGNDVIGAHAKDFNADVVISLQDIWVLPDNYREMCGRPWVCWFPVDHEPPPPRVLLMSRKADYPVVYSMSAQRMMEHEGLTCRYIPHGVDTKVFAPGEREQAREKLGWPQGHFVAAMVAANVGASPSRKAYPEQMTAFANFAHAHPELEAHLYVHTDHTEMHKGVDLHRLASVLDISERMIYVDLYQYEMGLSESYLASVYSAADVLLAASMGEGFGIPIIEAQACGCPVITTNFTSMPELTINGITTAPAQKFWTLLNSWAAVPSVERISNALAAIAYGDPESAQALRQLGVDHMRQSYEWDVVVEKYWRPFLEQVAQDIGR